MSRKPNSPDSPGQQQINFTRAEQLEALRLMDLSKVARLKSKDGSRVSPQTLRLVLRSIDDHAAPGRDAFPSHETIAAECDCSPTQSKRAVQILQAASLICIHRCTRKVGGEWKNLNHYRIVWNEVSLLSRRRDQSTVCGTLVSADQSTVEADQSTVEADQSTVRRDQSTVATVREPPRNRIGTATPLPPVENTSTADEWEEAAAELLKFGVKAGAALVRAARRDGAGEDFLVDVHRAIATAKANANRFDDPARAVYWYLCNGQWPVEGVLSLEEINRRKAARAREEAAAAEAARKVAAEDLEAKRILDELDEMYGPTLAAMTDKERLAAAAAVFPDQPFLIDRLRRGGDMSPFVRYEILKHIRDGVARSFSANHSTR